MWWSEGSGAVDSGAAGSRAVRAEAEGTGAVGGVFGSGPPSVCGEVAVH